MSEKIKPGMRIRDNSDATEWKVVRIEDNKAYSTDGRYTIAARLDRIHTDGKPRKSGFSLIKGETK